MSTPKPLTPHSISHPTSPLWNKQGYRLRLIHQHEGPPLHWLFLPGGPGLGSEYLEMLVASSHLPGMSWLVDYPGDGTNRDGIISTQNWQEGLLDLVQCLSPCVIVAHSFGGMLTLSVSELEEYLSGLILLNTAPDNQWCSKFGEIQAHHDFPDITPALQQYEKNPTDAGLEDFVLAIVDYYFTADEVEEGRALWANGKYCKAANDWGQGEFYPNYTAKWAPQTIPTMIIGGEEDFLFPVEAFKKDPRFHLKNIEIHQISKTSHHPWLQHLSVCQSLFSKFIRTLQGHENPAP